MAPDGPRDVPHLVRRLYHPVTGVVGRTTCFPGTGADLRLPTCTRSRLWDVADFRKQKAVLVAKAAQPGQRMSVSSAGFSRDGKLVVGGACADRPHAGRRVGASHTHPCPAPSVLPGVHNGSIKLWPTAGPHHRPSHVRLRRPGWG